MEEMEEIPIIPLDDRIVVQKHIMDKTEGGIILPNEQIKSSGIVRAVGPGARLPDGTRAELSLQVGDIVFFRDKAGSDVEGYSVMRENEIYAKLNKKVVAAAAAAEETTN